MELANATGRHPFARVERARWGPPPELNELLEHDVHLPLDIYTFEDEQRRVLVRGGFEPLLQVGPAIGAALMGELQQLSAADRSYHHGARVMFRYARGFSHRSERGMRAHLTRQLRCGADLSVRRSARAVSGTPETSLIPRSVGFVGRGARASSTWTITRLISKGRQLAIKMGQGASPNTETAIAFGFYAAAKLDPLIVEDEQQIDQLVKCALFDLEELPSSIDPALKRQVFERLAAALEKHRTDSPEEFDRWLYGAGSNLPKQLAKQRKSAGGVLNIDAVNGALLEIAWDSYASVGLCLHVLMRCVRHVLLSELELTEADMVIFDQTYQAQPYLAHLPLPLIVERMPFLRPALLEIWKHPVTQNEIPALHRMLAYYSQVAAERRGFDRATKQFEDWKACIKMASDKLRKDDRAEEEEEEDSSLDTPREQSTRSTFQVGQVAPRDRMPAGYDAAIEDLCRVHKLCCAQGCVDWAPDIQVLGGKEIDKKMKILLTGRCGCGEKYVELDEDAVYCALWERANS